MLFDSVTGEPPAGVVPLVVADPGPDDAATAAGLAAIGALPQSLRERVAQVEVSDPDDVVLTVADGPRVLWGSADDSGDKAGILAALLDRVEDGTLEPAAT